DVPGRAQQAVEPPSLCPGGTDGDPGAAVQGSSHGPPWYGGPPTESNTCLPLCKDFLRKFLFLGSGQRGTAQRFVVMALASWTEARPFWPLAGSCRAWGRSPHCGRPAEGAAGWLSGVSPPSGARSSSGAAPGAL